MPSPVTGPRLIGRPLSLSVSRCFVFGVRHADRLCAKRWRRDGRSPFDSFFGGAHNSAEPAFDPIMARAHGCVQNSNGCESLGCRRQAGANLRSSKILRAVAGRVRPRRGCRCGRADSFSVGDRRQVVHSGGATSPRGARRFEACWAYRRDWYGLWRRGRRRLSHRGDRGRRLLP